MRRLGARWDVEGADMPEVTGCFIRRPRQPHVASQGLGRRYFFVPGRLRFEPYSVVTDRGRGRWRRGSAVLEKSACILQGGAASINQLRSQPTASAGEMSGGRGSLFLVIQQYRADYLRRRRLRRRDGRVHDGGVGWAAGGGARSTCNFAAVRL